MRFKGLDLNLLVAFDILVEERSVSRAAQRLHISQPAMSAALGRLRTYFNDPILGAHGKRMIPTAHALRLRPMVRELLGSVEAMVTASAVFDPATAHRRFRIGTSDYLATVLFPRLIPAMEAEAPHITMELVAPSELMLSMLDQGDLDLVITPEEHTSPDHPSELLFEEPYVVAGWRENPIFSRRIAETDFLDAGHVVVEIGRLNRVSFAETNLRSFSARRRVEVTVSSFLLAPEMVINTRRLTVMHQRLAETFANRMPIAFAPLPFDFPAMREMVQYHRTRAEDAGLIWLRQRLHAAAKE
jgi:DNA-binding transcriptional LysR family regulator